ncbi:GNAT family N-acetyltransferase [Streptomyces sp. SL13]|uniref:Lysine N-acyltransferase MbtK n=1 Tax=Streptantibioticus silvisoli TaxID=2705255 RepID=A0AA90H3K3_9ACTN|nr:GNAT family N-acetyltransferase [Streptantibioticus silvisoli]MDI5966166.1 GNAT family N-acetyltransferase [Streptantibioticus silvisoli]MDI5972789.1 GNAT family N-acetyltransferase [Streptantibioticus silvisoli]
MRIAFSPLTRADFPLLASWLALPHVRAWWLDPEPTVAAVEAHYGDVVDGADPMRACVIRLDDAPVGLIQAYRHTDEPDWDRTVGVPDVAGVDYLIGPAEHRGKGVGSAAIRAFALLVLDSYPDVTGVVAVPLAANRASCRALEKAGFRHLESRELATDDPADAGISAIYLLSRPG